MPGTYFYPRSPCGERPGGQRPAGPDRQDFYPRSPCGERPITGGAGMMILPFLSTLSLRRATAALSGGTLSDVDFYPRSPCGERRAGKDPQDLIAKISIHALLAESDRPATRPAPNLSNFYPRSPCGERHNTGSRGCHRLDFYPRSPCGERRKPRRLKSRRCVFLSTLSLRRATLRVVDGSKSSIISIHALLAESDGKTHKLNKQN